MASAFRNGVLHGRGSLEGWLRTVMAQEFVNRFRRSAAWSAWMKRAKTAAVCRDRS